MSSEPTSTSRSPRTANRGDLAVKAADSADSADVAEHLERTDRWNGVRAGDPVLVSGLRLRGARWEFLAHIVNRRNGTESIEVVGGRPGDRRVRSFDPARIFPVTGSGRARPGSKHSPPAAPSLAEAPQLPFG